MYDRVMLLGYVNNFYVVVLWVKYYILVLINEGFLNVMLEVMVLGKVVIMFDCFFGLVEILVGNYVFLVCCLEMVEYGVLVFVNSLVMFIDVINCF